jgi:hypothetical protein
VSCVCRCLNAALLAEVVARRRLRFCKPRKKKKKKKKKKTLFDVFVTTLLQFKLVVLLALLLACARGQFEDDAELQELLSQIANEPLSFPDPMPVTVGRNAMSPLSRFAATSALPVWSLALLGFSGAVALVALAALIFSIVSKVCFFLVLLCLID